MDVVVLRTTKGTRIPRWGSIFIKRNGKEDPHCPLGHSSFKKFQIAGGCHIHVDALRASNRMKYFFLWMWLSLGQPKGQEFPFRGSIFIKRDGKEDPNCPSGHSSFKKFQIADGRHIHVNALRANNRMKYFSYGCGCPTDNQRNKNSPSGSNVS